LKVVDLLESRRKNWQELETLCAQLATSIKTPAEPAVIHRFAALHRAACADLALADSYQLPPATVQYLHQLVARAHSQLYRSRHFDFPAWLKMLLDEVPRRVVLDPCVWLTFCLFWGLFLLAGYLCYDPDTPKSIRDRILPPAFESMLEEMYENEVSSRSNANSQVAAAGGYVQHNTTIGLRCFAFGLAVIPGIYELISNAVVLGGAFGHMARPDVPQGKNFFEFVTAHGPFELNAIVLSAAAGLRIGLSWIYTRGLTRLASLEKTAKECMPVMGCAIALFVGAAMIEGFISPSALPKIVKQSVAVLCSGIQMFYFLVLGAPWRKSSAT
jgi:uncharacterized membrane protein SpoIIM required for sporulation